MEYFIVLGPRDLNPMAVITITSADPIQMYWRMVFYGAAEPGIEISAASYCPLTGLSTICLNQC